MTFEEIEHAARRDEKLPDGTSTIDYAAYYAMKRLYDLYWQKRITVDEASERKKQVRSAFERETKLYQNYMEFTKLYQDRVKKSELLRAEINKGISAGKDSGRIDGRTPGESGCLYGGICRSPTGNARQNIASSE